MHELVDPLARLKSLTFVHTIPRIQNPNPPILILISDPLYPLISQDNAEEMGQTCSQTEDSAVDQNYISSSANYDESEPPAPLLDNLHKGSILGLARNDSGIVFSCSDDCSIASFVWGRSGTDSLIKQHYYKGHKKAVNRIACDHVNKHLWSISRDLSIKRWDIESGECIQTLSDAHELNISSIVLGRGEISPFVFTGSRDYSVKKWDMNTSKCISNYKVPRNIVTAMVLGGNNNGTMIYQASEDLKIRVWDTRKSTCTKPAAEIGGLIYFGLCLDINQEGSGNLLAVGCKGFNSVGCEVKIYDIRNTAIPISVNLGHSQDVTGCKFLANEKNTLVSCSKDGSIFAWNATDAESTIPIASNKSTKIYTSLIEGEETLSNTFTAGAYDGSANRFEINEGDKECGIISSQSSTAHFEKIEDV